MPLAFSLDKYANQLILHSFNRQIFFSLSQSITHSLARSFVRLLVVVIRQVTSNNEDRYGSLTDKIFTCSIINKLSKKTNEHLQKTISQHVFISLSNQIQEKNKTFTCFPLVNYAHLPSLSPFIHHGYKYLMHLSRFLHSHLGQSSNRFTFVC